MSTMPVQVPPEITAKWQDIVDLLAQIVQVPSALVMKVDPPNIRVLVSSDSKGNPYTLNEAAPLNTGLYCETVMRTREPLLVPDALADEKWKSNPDVKLGLISYMGFPVAWPDGEIFGTICVLDDKRNEYNELYRKLLLQCREVLQGDLRWLTRLGGELTTQKGYLDELFALVPEAIAMVDGDGHLMRINGEFSRIFGYSSDEATGRSLHELVVPEDLRSESVEFARRVTERQEIVNTETIRQRKDGSRVPVSIVGVPASLKEGKISGWVIYRDITRRKRLEDELKDERDRLRLLLEITNCMVSKLDLRGLLDELSASLLRVMHCDHCALLLPDSDSGKLRATMLYNSESRGITQEGMIVPMTGSISGKVFRTGKSLRIDNIEMVRNDPEVFGNPDGHAFYERVKREGLVSGCYLPLMSRGRVLAVLNVCKRSVNGFTENDMVFLEQVAHQIAIAVENALDYGRATEDRDREAEQKLYLQDEIRTEHNFGEIIGANSGLKSVLDQVAVVAPTDSSVLILGETGTGKELIARAIHDLSRRRERTFVRLNCAAIPLGLLESELFGHEKGAFTGAITQKMGRFELANKGSLFLDEVGDIPLELQAKLLRVLQEQEFERLGSNRTHKVDVRIIAATHRDLAQMVKQQAFREDLYYRLKVFPISVPSLRHREQDIPQLVRHFATRYARKMNKKIETIPAETMDALVHYGWPGNVRELQNFVERAVILSRTPVLHAPLGELEPSQPNLQTRAAPGGVEAERDQIIQALDASKWVVGGPNGAAARLGLARTSLVYKMQKFGIRRAH
ncbi:MAG TPA: sigma 54-interacting transcriptional regulator [Candidatus Sulfotelmatobacter sp.]|nr:sigma 54-interacting transcriptional regulator [Candidatus Sulfotelmatobacter sp.]